MGQMRFYTPQSDSVGARPLDDWEVQCAYMAGIEGAPWRSRNSYADGLLTIDRMIDESGCLFLPWPRNGAGYTTISTASLRERDEPYLLPLELARGVVNRSRSQAAEWEIAGLQVPDELREQLREATAAFISAATIHNRDAGEAATRADQAIEQALAVGGKLADQYAQQSLAIRRSQTQRLPTLLAASIDGLPENDEIKQQLIGSFNSVAVPLCWKDIEPNAGEYVWDKADRYIQWCQANGLRVCGGPLLSLDRFSLPDWVYLWEDDFKQLADFLLQFISAAVERYRGQVHLWQAAARVNVDSELALGEEQRLKLTVGAVETIRRIDPQTPVVVNFDQPWGEYLSHKDMELSPLHFADTLIRAEMGLAGLGLEVNLGYWPNGTLPRTLLDISRLIDRWSILGLPLLVLLTCPSETAPDPLAEEGIVNAAGRNVQDDARRIIELLLAKSTVHGIVWNQLTDSTPHRFPFGGLYGPGYQPKPLLQELAELRQAHLM